MPGDGECCPWFSWTFHLLDLHSHTKKYNNKSEMSIQLGLVMVSTVFGLVGHFTSLITILYFFRRRFIDINKQYIKDSRKDRHKKHSEINNEERKRERQTRGSHSVYLCQIIWDRSD